MTPLESCAGSIAATQICCVPPLGNTTPYGRSELKATQYRSPGGAQVGWLFSNWPVVTWLFTHRFALTSSTPSPPRVPSLLITNSCAVTSPCPPLVPRE